MSLEDIEDIKLKSCGAYFAGLLLAIAATAAISIIPLSIGASSESHKENNRRIRNVVAKYTSQEPEEINIQEIRYQEGAIKIKVDGENYLIYITRDKDHPHNRWFPETPIYDITKIEELE